MESTEDILKQELKKFRKLSGVVGSAIIRRDGLMILSDLSSEVNSKAIAAMAAAIVGTGETASKELGIGEMEEVVIESRSGKLISIGAGKESIFVALVKKKVNLGLILIEMEKIARKVEKVISS
jgi:predicted regulator of Ras-like GTPase activity (Roadblock/LC7/MglB family)